jgi:endonuclease YncB( thermonuclease family)
LRSITGHAVKLIAVDKDRYGRIVGEVYNGEINLNLAQVQARKAAVYDAYCKKSIYNEAEQ